MRIRHNHRVAILLNDGTYTSIFAGCHGLEIFSIFLGIEFCIWVERAKHGVNAGSHYFCPINAVNEMALQGIDGSTHNLKILLSIETGVCLLLFFARLSQSLPDASDR